MKSAILIMLVLTFIANNAIWWKICSNLQQVKPESYEVVFEDDCYIKHGGKEMKLISVKDLKL